MKDEMGIPPEMRPVLKRYGIDERQFIWDVLTSPPMTYNGIEIIANPWVPEWEPTLKLRAKCPCSTKFRKEFDRWLLDMFGRKRVMLPMFTKVIAHHSTVAALRKEKLADTPI